MVGGHFLMTKTSPAQAIREGSFGFLVQTLARSLDAKMKDALLEVGVELKLFPILRMLAEEDGINQRKLGQRLNFPEYFTSRNIDALVETGFAERRPDPDSRRSFLIFLTDAGHAKGKSLPPIIRRVNDDVLGNLTASEQKQVVALMQKIAGVASK